MLAMSLNGVAATTMAGAPAISNLPKAQASEEKVVAEPYDYIIAGGGLAGCVLAERLSQDKSKKVLVLEAGRSDYNNMKIRIPAGILRVFRSVYDWQHETGGESSCNGRNVFLQRGKVLGGSSCTNACLSHRGSAKDYDDWGVPGWSSEEVLENFKFCEDDKTGRDSKYHGKKGDWTMDDVRYQNPLSKRFLKIAGGIIGSNDDFNNWGRDQKGAGRFQVSQRNGERLSGATAFLAKALKRKNVKVRTGVMARRINFDDSKTATGVTYDLMGDDTCTSFKAKLNPGGEVLLASGAIASPQLLLCSGIGPAEDLEEHGIPVVANNPNVGKNLQDQPAAVVSYKTPKKGVSVTSKLRLFGKTNPLPVLNWLIFKRGLLTSTGCDHGLFTRTSGDSSGPCDLQMRFLAAKALTADGMTTFSQFRNIKKLEDGYSFQSIACRAKSEGSVKLVSSNSHVKPMIDGGYLSNSEDLKTLREGIKLGRKLGTNPDWAEYLGEEVFPGKDVQSDAQIDEYIKNTIHTSNALTGTCKMGTGADAVVGPDLRVLGVNGVRVADSSIIPVIPGGQTGTPTVMIADRASNFIKGVN